VRGVSTLAPVLRTFKQLGRYTDAELDAALVNALFAVTVETTESPSEVAERLSVSQARTVEAERASFYAQNPVRLQGVRATLLRPGDKLNLNAGSRQTRDASAFESALLTKVCANLGLSLEQLTGDWSKTTYSSARAGALHTARWLRARRTEHKARFVGPFYLVWLAEAFDRGFLKAPAGAPSFEAYPEAYARCDWLTPGLGWVDPVKEAEGAQARVSLGLSTLQQECAEQGRDWTEVASQLQREVAHYQSLGLTHPAERPLPARGLDAAADDDRPAVPPR
jgi:lambda family phage portal protein